MSIRRFLLPENFSPQELYLLSDKERHYLCRVLRLENGDEIEVFDGKGKEGKGELEVLPSGSVGVRVKEMRAREKRSKGVLLGQALPKGRKMDLIIEKVTELGVERVVPLLTKRALVRLRDEEGEKKLGRWRRIAAQAARQSRHAFVPEVSPPMRFDDFIAPGPPPGFLPLLLWEEGKRELREIVRVGMDIYPLGVLVLVGPEGGFEGEEVKRAERKGFIPVGMGRYILRTETAAIAISSILQYELGSFSYEGQKERG